MIGEENDVLRHANLNGSADAKQQEKLFSSPHTIEGFDWGGDESVNEKVDDGEGHHTQKA